jgi:hypothetical protein
MEAHSTRPIKAHQPHLLLYSVLLDMYSVSKSVVIILIHSDSKQLSSYAPLWYPAAASWTVGLSFALPLLRGRRASTSKSVQPGKATTASGSNSHGVGQCAKLPLPNLVNTSSVDPAHPPRDGSVWWSLFSLRPGPRHGLQHRPPLPLVPRTETRGLE